MPAQVQQSVQVEALLMNLGIIGLHKPTLKQGRLQG
jgi:hypothetical protein